MLAVSLLLWSRWLRLVRGGGTPLVPMIGISAVRGLGDPGRHPLRYRWGDTVAGYARIACSSRGLPYAHAGGRACSYGRAGSSVWPTSRRRYATWDAVMIGMLGRARESPHPLAVRRARGRRTSWQSSINNLLIGLGTITRPTEPCASAGSWWCGQVEREGSGPKRQLMKLRRSCGNTATLTGGTGRLPTGDVGVPSTPPLGSTVRSADYPSRHLSVLPCDRPSRLPM